MKDESYFVPMKDESFVPKPKSKQKHNQLHIPLERKYYDLIKNEEKQMEYRNYDKWISRLTHNTYDEIYFKLGYPKTGDFSRIVVRKYKYFEVGILYNHPLYNYKPTKVCAIKT